MKEHCKEAVKELLKHHSKAEVLAVLDELEDDNGTGVPPDPTKPPHEEGN